MNDRRRESRKRRSTAFRDGWTAWRRASRNPAAPRNAVSPWETLQADRRAGRQKSPCLEVLPVYAVAAATVIGSATNTGRWWSEFLTANVCAAVGGDFGLRLV